MVGKMRITRWIFAALLTMLCQAAQAYAQSPVYYYWVKPDQVYIWRSMTDSDFVLIRWANEEWVIPQNVRVDDNWQHALRAGPVKGASGDPWEAFLNKLRDDRPNDQWVKPRYPDVEIYIRTQKDNSLKLSFIRNGELQTFAVKKDGQWKTPENMKLETLIDSSVSAREAASNNNAVGFPTIPRSRKEREGLQSKWIDARLNGSELFDAQMYINSQGGRNWLWVERLSEENWISHLQRGMALPPAGVVIQNLPATQIPLYKQWWLTMIFGFALGCIALAVAPRVSLLRDLLPKQTEPQVGTGNADDDDKEADNQSVKEKPKTTAMKENKSGKNSKKNTKQPPPPAQNNPGQGGPPSGTAVGEINEPARTAFNGVLGDLQQLANTLTRSAISPKDYGIENMKPEEARALITLGNQARSSYASLQKSHPENASSEPRLFQKNETEMTWYKNLPALISNLESGIKEKDQGLKEAKSREVELSNRINDYEKSSSSTAQTVTKKEEELRNVNAELERVKTQRDNLLTTQDDLESARDNLQQEKTAFEKRLEHFNVIKKLSTYLRQGHYSYFDSHKDPALAAIVSFLIHHSLFQLSVAVFEDDEIRKQSIKQSMLSNLYVISKRLEKVDGKEVKGFGTVINEINKNYPAAGSFESSLIPSSESHNEAELFQVLIRFVEIHAHLSLGPYYFDVDPDGKSYRAN